MTFEQWITTPGVIRCYLVEAQYSLGGNTYTLRRATMPYFTGKDDTPAWTPYPETIIRIPEVERDMAEVFSGVSRTTLGEVEFFLDEELQQLVTTANFAGQPITIKVGDPTWDYSQFKPIVTNALGESLQADINTAILTFQDRSVLFSQPVQPDLIATGPNKGKPKPLCFGQCFNVSPVLIDSITNKWMVHEGSIEGILVVRENGVDITANVTDHLDGTFTINVSTTGRITADVKGAKPSGTWLQTGEDFIDYLLTKMNLSAAVDTGVFPAYLMQLYISETKSIANALDDIVNSYLGSWHFDRLNQFRLRLYPEALNGAPAVPADLSPDDIINKTLKPTRALQAAKSVQLGYAKNWTPMPDSLAGSVRENQPDLATQLESPEQIQEQNNGALANEPGTITLVLSTLIVNQADAATEAQRRLNISATPRTVFELDALTAPFQMELCQEITIDNPNYFDGGRQAVITRIIDKPDRDQSSLEVVA